MGLILKREEIISFLKENKLYDGTEKIIWANIENAQGPMVILTFNETGIITLPITSFGNIEGNIIIAENSEIKHIVFKKSLMFYKLTIDSSSDDIPEFRVNKIMIGYKEHREELATLVSKYS